MNTAVSDRLTRQGRAAAPQVSRSVGRVSFRKPSSRLCPYVTLVLTCCSSYRHAAYRYVSLRHTTNTHLCVRVSWANKINRPGRKTCQIVHFVRQPYGCQTNTPENAECTTNSDRSDNSQQLPTVTTPARPVHLYFRPSAGEQRD